MYITSIQPGEYLTPGGLLYFPALITNTGGNTNTAGVGCINLVTVQSCGFTPLTTTSPAPNGTYAPIYSNSRVTVGGEPRMYLSDTQGNIFCFNPGTAAVCAGTWPVNLDSAPGTAPHTGFISIEAFCDRMGDPSSYNCLSDGTHDAYLFTTLRRNDLSLDLLCFNVQTSAGCTGYPVNIPQPAGALTLNARFIAPMLDSAGNVEGACWQVMDGSSVIQPQPPYGWNCYTTEGNPVASPLPPAATLAGTAGYDIVGYNGFGSPLVVNQTKVYFPVTNTPGNAGIYACWDYGATPSPKACDGYTSPNRDGTQPYSFREDPANLGCLWMIGNLGVVEPFSAATGALGCPPAGNTQAKPADFYCDEDNPPALSWATASVVGIAPENYTSATFTIRDVNGTVVRTETIPGGAGADQSLDISNIPITGNTATLSAEVDLNGGTIPPGATPTVELRWNGPAPQVCFSTTTPDQCNNLPATIANTATLVVTVGNASSTTTASDSLNVIAGDECDASVTVVKSHDEATFVAGQVIHYHFEVTNTGDVTLDPVVVNDSVIGPVTCPQTTLAAGASMTCNANYQATPANFTAGVINNTVTVTGTPPTGPAVTDSDSDTIPAAGGNPAIEVEKSHTPGAFTAGTEITYTFDVTNTGNVPLTDLVLVDSVLGTIADCDDRDLAVNGTTQCRATYTATGADVAAGTIDNEVKATGTDPAGNDVSDTDTDTIPAKDHKPCKSGKKDCRPGKHDKPSKPSKQGGHGEKPGKGKKSHVLETHRV